MTPEQMITRLFEHADSMPWLTEAARMISAARAERLRLRLLLMRAQSHMDGSKESDHLYEKIGEELKR